MKHYYIFLIILLSGMFLFTGTHNANAALRAQCTVFPSDNVVPGEEVTWIAEGIGGEETYQYIWSGSDGLRGNGREASIRYQTQGSKRAQVTVISGQEQSTVTCSQIDVKFPILRGACYVSTKASRSGVHSTYATDIMGGNGVYTYTWSGTDNAVGNESVLRHTYTTPGFKAAAVNISSAGQQITLTCNVDVPEIRSLPDSPIIFGCEGESDRFVTREDFEWISIYSVPNSYRNRVENISYRWEGTDDKYSENGDFEDDDFEEFETRYNTAGYKTMNLKVNDSFRSFRADSSCQTFLANIRDVGDHDTFNIQQQWRQRDTGASDEERYISSGIRIDYNVPEFDACFIASAAYGSKWEPQVETLRDFRDARLETNLLGRLFVDTYYAVSPGYAFIIQQSDMIRMHARVLLSPLVISAKTLL